MGKNWLFSIIMITFTALSNCFCMNRCTSKLYGGLKVSRFVHSGSYTDVITSVTNEKVKLLKSLQIKKKRDSTNLIVLEGFRHIHDALAAGILPKHLLMVESAKQSPQFPSLFNLLKQHQLISKIDYISESIFNQLSDTVNGQGIIGAFEKPLFPANLRINSTNSATPPFILLLDRIQDPGNLGTIIRSSFALGVHSILCVNCCDIWSPKVLRASLGYALQLPLLELAHPEEVYPALDTLQKDFRPSSPWSWSYFIADASVVESDTNTAPIDYTKPNYQVPLVLIMGSEASGVQPSLLAHLQTSSSHKEEKERMERIYIPMQRNVESFNVAIASSIITEEIAKQRRK